MSQDESNIFYSSLRGRLHERNVDFKLSRLLPAFIANKK